MTREGDRDTMMGYSLPVICLEDFVLEGERVIEFLSDICFSQYPTREYLERK